MKLAKWFTIIAIIFCCLSMSTVTRAEGTGDGSSSSNELFDGLMNILQEGIEEFIGNYKGSLGDVKLLERLGNKIVLEVTYDNVKRSDNVYVQGEVWQYGNKLEGFSNTLSSVRGSHGKAILSIGWVQDGDEGWGTTTSKVQSDQVRLFLVRKSNPDRPFGEILYDMSKVWIDSDAPDEASMVAENDSIELEEGEAEGEAGTESRPSVFIKPGTTLRPYKPGVTLQNQPAVQSSSQGTAQGTAPANTQSTIQRPPVTTQTKPAAPTLGTPVQTKQARPFSGGVQSYDFYQNARSAKWRSSAGPLAFPGRSDDKRGYVKQLSSTTLNSGNKAVNLIQTHPEWKPNGWIDAHYPLMIPGSNLHFKSIVGFVKGANQSDGATFQVYVKENKKYYRMASTRVTAKKYARIDADLSKFAGKKVQVVLRVRADKTSKQDWAVWVKPRLTK